MFGLTALLLLLALPVPLVKAVASQTYTWKNVKIGGGGGFVPGIVFNPSEKGLAYARTDIGGAYKLNADDSWTPLLDFTNDTTWDYWGVDALATDPVDTERLYLAVGEYTNSWDPNNGAILRSSDYGKSFAKTQLPFKVGGNMPGRGIGERLAVDPNLNSVLYLGARSGNGLYKSTDYGVTWTKVASFTSTGTYVQDPTDTTGYSSDKTGLSFVTFDSTSGAKGSATPRIFVGVATVGAANIFMSTDAGSTWTGLTGYNNSYMPHKGVLQPAEKALYLSMNNNAGPYDGTLGAVLRYDITAGTFADISPVSGSDLYFGFGGLSVDLQVPGTVMVATVNSWWPDGNIYRSLDSGKTWSPLWAWASYPSEYLYYSYDTSLAPWISADRASTDTKQIGWMMEALSIDPFDSNHWLYGTGLTVYGGRDLLKWDTVHNVTLKSLADGIEETSIQGLMSPPTGPPLVSAVGDVGGFVHTSLTVAPEFGFLNPAWATSTDVDYAGLVPTTYVRAGNGDTTTGKSIALSTDSGNTWSQDYGVSDSMTGGKVAISASGDTVLWSTSANGVQVSQYTNPFAAVASLPAGAVIASDKTNNTIFYAASGSSFYVSRDGGKTFIASASKLGTSAYPVKIVVNTKVAGDAWISTDTGLFHTTDFGDTVTKISGITEAWAIALGAPKTSGGYPALFAAANIGGVGYFRSDDEGVNWVQINDATHGFGSASANVMAADMNTYGRVYIGTNGRGIFYGDATGSSPPPTTTISSTTTTTTSTTTKSSTSSSKSSTSSSKSSTTTTVSSSTKTTTTTSSTATSTGVVAKYGQCGGQGYTGPTTCAAGSTCTYSNPYYSQCT